ncbi:MAG: PorT family protein [Cytophagaceae bacterium]|jgi:hypothetical protein|nr:PorT family protein [Cytophagaceae bacterium]
MKLTLLAFFSFLLLAFTSRAGLIGDSALTCTQKLNRAQKVYDAGKISEVEPLLKECIKEGFTKEEKMQALRLLILSFLFQDEHQKAEKQLLELLHEDPEYTLNPAIDPAEFYQLFRQYRTLPVISIGILGGVNRTGVTERKSYTVNSLDNGKADYTSRLGFQLGVLADILLYKNWQLNTGFIWNLKQFTYSKELLYSNYTTLTSRENQMWLDMPLALKYVLGNKKIKPYALAGVSNNWLISATSRLSRVNTDESSAANQESLNFGKQRRKLGTNALLGAGFRYKVGFGYICLEARYQFGLNNLANADNRFLSEDGRSLFYHGYISSDFSVNNLAFSVGYFKSFYKPKKNKIKDFE